MFESLLKYLPVSLGAGAFNFASVDATREVDDGILVVESWLMSATEYIAIDNTLLRPGVQVDGRSGMARPDQSAGHAKLKSLQPLFC